MNKQQIDKLLEQFDDHPDLIETHISWVILTNGYAYKIKKPVLYEFLDFSTLEKRKFYCDREVILNRRLTEGMYLGVVPVYRNANMFSLEKGEGDIVDYAVKMVKIDPESRMDNRLREKQVTKTHLEAIANILIDFHRNTEIIYNLDLQSVQKKFNALGDEVEFVATEISNNVADQIMSALISADNFISNHQALFKARLRDGYVRDCHGDLHARNIFLTEVPVIFDCIEFNDDYRKTDVLSEVAFLCMDLEAFGYSDLADYFFYYYNSQFNICDSHDEQNLFIYYKAHYANIRAKVNILRVKNEDKLIDSQKAREEIDKYATLLSGYVSALPT